MSKPNIFSYFTARDFISDILEYQKARNPKYSLRVLSKKCQISPAALSDYLGGKNFLSPNNSIKVMGALNLKNNEIDYFFLLAMHERALDLENRKKIYERLASKSQNAQSEVPTEVFLVFQGLEIEREHSYFCKEKSKIRVLTLFRNKFSGERSPHFLDHFFSSSRQVAVTAYFIENDDRTFRCHFNRGFSKDSHPNYLSNVNQSLKVTFNAEGLPHIENTTMSALETGMIVEASIRFSRESCSVIGTMKDPNRSFIADETVDDLYKRV